MSEQGSVATSGSRPAVVTAAIGLNTFSAVVWMIGALSFAPDFPDLIAAGSAAFLVAFASLCAAAALTLTVAGPKNWRNGMLMNVLLANPVVIILLLTPSARSYYQRVPETVVS